MEEKKEITQTADGTIVFPSQKALDDVLAAQAKAAIDALNLKPAPAISPLPAGGDGAMATAFDPKSLAEGSPTESKYTRRKRLLQAVKHIQGGTLALEHAPKELKTIRYFKALYEHDDITQKSLSEGSATDGGNLVPVEFGTDLKVAIEEYTVVNDCDQIEMTTSEFDLRSVTTKPVVYQVDEGVAVTEAATKVGKPQLIAKKFAGLQIMSRELFQDNNVGLYDKLVTLFAEAFAARISQEIIKGTTFTGVLGSAITKTTIADTSIANVKYGEIVALLNSLSPGQLAKGGKVYMHRTILGVLQGMVDQLGRPILQNPWDAQNRALLGYPIHLDEQCPALSADAANTGFIVFGNLMWVAFGKRQEVTAQMLTEGTVNTINLAEKRSLGLIIDTRFGVVVEIAGNLAGLFTHA